MNGAVERKRTEWLKLVFPLTAVAASGIVRAVSWPQRAYNHDDFYFAYLSWLRSTPAVPGRDYYVPNFNPFAELWSPLFRTHG